MPKRFHLLLLCLLSVATGAVQAQMPPPPPDACCGQGARKAGRQMTDEERAEHRAEMRQRREAWQQMSPEDRQQLRREIRDAGHMLYPRHRRGPPD